MPEPAWLILAVVAAALLFDFTNGWNDSANAIATTVSTRVLSPLQALLLAAAMNVVGALAFTAVAKAIGSSIVNPQLVTQYTILAAMAGGIAWNVWMTLLGLPISASHALIGGLVGGALAQGGVAVVVVSGLKVILLAMLISPALGFILGWGLMRLVYRATAQASPTAVKRWSHASQILTTSLLSFTHGTNDAQKVMGVITLALFAGGYIPSIEVPLWVKLSSALIMGLGTAIGGWRVIKTLGMRMLHMKPIHGATAEIVGTAILTATAYAGVPVSTTHTITGSILGVGAARRVSAVRWGIAGKIIYAWIFTLPGSGLIAYVAYQFLLLFHQ